MRALEVPIQVAMLEYAHKNTRRAAYTHMFDDSTLEFSRTISIQHPRKAYITHCRRSCEGYQSGSTTEEGREGEGEGGAEGDGRGMEKRRGRD